MAQGPHKEQKQNRNLDNKPYGTRKYILKQDKGKDRMSHKYITQGQPEKQKMHF